MIILTLRPHYLANVSSLDEPAFDNPMYGGSCVSNDLAVVPLETLAEPFEILTSFGACVLKKLKNDLLSA